MDSEYTDDELREEGLAWYRSEPTQKLRRGLLSMHEQRLTRLRELSRNMGDEGSKEQISYSAGCTDILEMVLGLVEGFGPTREADDSENR